MSFILSSPDFSKSGTIPDRYLGSKGNIQPRLEIDGTPDGTASLAIVMHDPDGQSGDLLHWAVWNLSPKLKIISGNDLSDEAVQGMNDFGKVGYTGPCPQTSTHHYIFILYALDDKLNISSGANKETLSEALADHTITLTTLVGRFRSNKKP